MPLVSHEGYVFVAGVSKLWKMAWGDLPKQNHINVVAKSGVAGTRTYAGDRRRGVAGRSFSTLGLEIVLGTTGHVQGWASGGVDVV